MELKGPFPKKMLRKQFGQDLSFNVIEGDSVLLEKTIKEKNEGKDFGSVIKGYICRWIHIYHFHASL